MIGFIAKLVRTITLQRVLLWSLAGSIGIVGYTAFEHRTHLFGGESETEGRYGNPVNVAFEIQESSRNLILNFMQREPSVLGVTIFSADLRLNSRRAVLNLSKNKIKEDDLAFQAVTRLPLFTSNDSENRLTVRILNGEFYCSPYALTLLSRTAPTLNKQVVSVCRASLPPYYGYFSGFVNVYLSKEPDAEEQIRLRTEVDAIANELYFKDVIPTSKILK